MMHEVGDGSKRCAEEFSTGLTAEFLETIVVHLLRERWDLVTLEEGIARLGRGDPTRRFAVLTFDDAYRDTLTRALPVLERHGAPFTVYVPSGAPTRELYSWWLGLRALFQRHDRVVISAMEASFDCSDRSGKTEGLGQVLAWVHGDYRRAALLDETFRRYGISLAGLNDIYFLSESQLCTLANHPLVNIGAHTVSHTALSLLETAAVREEFIGNRRYLENLTGRRVVDFAYPYGGPLACGEREFALAAQAGFRSGVTTRYGPLFANHRHDVHALPRIAAGGTSEIDEYAATLAALRNATT